MTASSTALASEGRLRERVAEAHHSDRGDGAHGIDDALAGDIGGGAWEEGIHQRRTQVQTAVDEAKKRRPLSLSVPEERKREDELTMNRLVDGVFRTGQPAQTGARQQADASGDDARLVGDDVAEEVARDDDAVEAAGVLDEDHGRRVDEVVLDLELGNSFSKTSFMTLRQRRDVASTLALSRLKTVLSPRARARKPARGATRSISRRE